MKVTSRTETQLIIQHSSTFLWLACAVLVAIGLSIFVIPIRTEEEVYVLPFLAYASIGWGVSLGISGRTTVWTFDKSTGSLLIRNRSLFGVTLSEYSLQEVYKAQIESKVADSDGEELLGNRFGVRLALLNADSLHLCPDYSLSSFAAQEAVRQISSFLNS